jgi:hypothetical protein
MLPAPWREKKAENRVAMFCYMGSLAAASRELNPDKHRYEAKKIRLAVWNMLEQMHKRDHCADWVDRGQTTTGRTKRKRKRHDSARIEGLLPPGRKQRELNVPEVRRGAA